MSKAKSRTLSFLKYLGISILAVLILLALWLVPQWQLNSRKLSSSDKQAEMENAYRATLLQALGGAFFFVTAYFTYRNVRATEANVRATEEKQVTERFGKAIELLGSEKLEARLGGIYALEQIAAKDSPKDYWTIVEILTAYVREKAPNSEPVEEQEEYITPIPTDIQAVLTVHARRKYDFGGGEKHPLDLRKTSLQGADLEGANLSGANLSNVNLQQANLGKANFTGANLSRANLYRTELLSAKLEHAYLIGANLRESNLAQASLRKASFLNTNLHEAILSYADFSMSLNLTPEQVKSASGWEKAIYDEYFRKELGLPTESGDGRQND